MSNSDELKCEMPEYFLHSQKGDLCHSYIAQDVKWASCMFLTLIDVLNNKFLSNNLSQCFVTT